MTNEIPTMWTGPLPEPIGETQPFWDACATGTFLVQRCSTCDKVQYPYRGFCCHCWADTVVDTPIAGTGTVWAFSVVHRNRSKGHVQTEPYVVGVVELAEGPRVVTNIYGKEPDAIRIGDQVRLDFVDAPNGMKIPVFECRT